MEKKPSLNDILNNAGSGATTCLVGRHQTGQLPISADRLLNEPSGNLFGLTQNVGMGRRPDGDAAFAPDGFAAHERSHGNRRHAGHGSGLVARKRTENSGAQQIVKPVQPHDVVVLIGGGLYVLDSYKRI